MTRIDRGATGVLAALVLGAILSVSPACAETTPASAAAQHWAIASDRAVHQDWAGVITELDAILAAQPNSPQVLTVRGDMHLRLQQWALADADFSRAIQLYGADRKAAGPLMQRAQLRGAAHPEEAFADAARAVQVDPDSAEARYAYAGALWQRDRNAQALEQVDRALALDGAPALYHQLRGLILEQVDRMPEAKAELDIGVQREPKMFMVWSARASLALKMGDIAAAREDAASALKLYPESDEARIDAALADGLLGNLPAAVAGLKTVAARSPARLAARSAIRGASPDDILGRLVRDESHAARAELVWGLVAKARGDQAAATAHFDAALKRDDGLRADVAVARAAALP